MELGSTFVNMGVLSVFSKFLPLYTRWRRSIRSLLRKSCWSMVSPLVIPFVFNLNFLNLWQCCFSVPRIAEAIIALVKPLLHPAMQKQFHVYGPDKDQWIKVLLELIDADQLPS